MPKGLASDLQATVAFLRSIGLEIYESDDAHGFLKGVVIRAGTLVYNPLQATPSNLLHEAGHLAIIPARFRTQAQDDIRAIIEVMCDEIGRLSEEHPDRFDPDAPEIRAIMQAGDPEATAWAFAAGRAVGLPDEVIILGHEYDGTGDSVRLGLARNCYIGINGLVAGGMCERVKAFPHLTRWLQN